MIKYVSVYNVSTIYEACFLGKYRFDIKKNPKTTFLPILFLHENLERNLLFNILFSAILRYLSYVFVSHLHSNLPPAVLSTSSPSFWPRHRRPRRFFLGAEISDSHLELGQKDTDGDEVVFNHVRQSDPGFDEWCGRALSWSKTIPLLSILHLFLDCTTQFTTTMMTSCSGKNS